jgi:hypothetical protein
MKIGMDKTINVNKVNFNVRSAAFRGLDWYIFVPSMTTNQPMNKAIRVVNAVEAIKFVAPMTELSE